MPIITTIRSKVGSGTHVKATFALWKSILIEILIKGKHLKKGLFERIEHKSCVYSVCMPHGNNFNSGSIFFQGNTHPELTNQY